MYNGQESEANIILAENLEALSAVNESSKQPETCYNTITTCKGKSVLYCEDCQWLDNSDSSLFSGTDSCNP